MKLNNNDLKIVVSWFYWDKDNIFPSNNDDLITWIKDNIHRSSETIVQYLKNNGLDKDKLTYMIIYLSENEFMEGIWNYLV